MTGAITGYIDVAQLTLYAFWIFFAGLIIYLRREDKREGYPLESDRSARSAGRVTVQGFPAIPAPKTFRLAHGGTYTAPPGAPDARPVAAEPTGNWPGAPLEPTGDPMRDAVGPAAYAERAQEPDRTVDGEAMIVPLRVLADVTVDAQDEDPRGMEVIGADRRTAGTVTDLWIDRAEPQIRYLEVALPPEGGARTVLLPITFALIDQPRRQVTVRALLAEQFAGVPAIVHPEQVTRREEDRITAYYAGGTLYATPGRSEPIV